MLSSTDLSSLSKCPLYSLVSVCETAAAVTSLFQEDLQTRVTKLMEVYTDGLNNNLFLELKQFISLLKLQPQGFFSSRAEEIDKMNDKILSPLKVLNWLIDLDMVQVFPNVYIAYRLLLTIPIAN